MTHVPQFGAFVVSFDFELHWGVRDHMPPNGAYRQNVLGSRVVIPRLLKLFERFEIAATWATVGFLFAASRNERERFKPDVLPNYRNAALNPYAEATGEGEHDDPLHYAGSLIDQIAQCPRQEIATHTFSHYYSLEPGQTLSSFKSDLRSAVAIAAERSIELRSIVFPRNQVNPAYAGALLEAGITCYRGPERGWMYHSTPRSRNGVAHRAARLVDSYFGISGPQILNWRDIQQESGLCNVRGSRFLRPYQTKLKALERLRLRRITSEMELAARENGIYHLWLHPHNLGIDIDANLEFFEHILQAFALCRTRYGMRSLSMQSVAELVDGDKFVRNTRENFEESTAVGSRGPASEVVSVKSVPHSLPGSARSQRTKSQRIIFVDNSVDSFRHDRMELCYAARAMDMEVHIAAPPGPAAAAIVKEGFTFHEILMTRKGTSAWTEPATVFALVRLYRSVRPNLVHHFRLKPVLYGSLAASLSGVPAVVNTLTGLGHVFTDPSERLALLRRLITLGCRRAFRHRHLRVVFQNPDDRAVFIRDGIIPADQTTIIKGSGVNVCVFAPSPEPDGTPVVVLASRMLWDKGVAQFVEAAQILKTEGVQATFVLVGPPDPDNPASISWEQLQLWKESGNVEWWGLQKDMPQLLAKSHIVCLPSYREGIPRILIEAAACGRPIVTTDAPGCRELVRPGDNGLIVPVQDTPALVSALRTLIQNPEMRKAMGNFGRQLAVQEFDIELVIAQYRGIYQELLAGRSTRPAAQTYVPGTSGRKPRQAAPGTLHGVPQPVLETQKIQSQGRP
jgi:glycosyltransferase involved in cell wall biosynthesis/peptidoglycan/xylan/chitin deacetylase (PgdA/CDA1 family)